jgi:hypothetical protein
MNDIFERKKLEVLDAKDVEEEGMDLMGAMIRTSGYVSGTAPEKKNQDGGLSKDEIIGNAFVLFLAGHETAANSIHFAIILLATRPALQRQVQGKPPLIRPQLTRQPSWTPSSATAARPSGRTTTTCPGSSPGSSAPS